MPDTLEDTLKEDRCPIYIKDLKDAGHRIMDITDKELGEVLTCVFDLDDKEPIRSWYDALTAAKAILSETAKCKAAGFCDEGYIYEKIGKLKLYLPDLAEYSGHGKYPK